MTTRAYERSLRAETVESLLVEAARAYNIDDIVILPIPTTRDGRHVNGHDVTLEAALLGARRGSLVIGYGIHDYIKDTLADRGAIVVDSEEDEEFLLDNAELTAMATVGILLNTEVRVPRDLSIGIVGYGRIGAALTRHLLYHGARVTVFTLSDEKRLDLSQCGIRTVSTREPHELGSLDLLINTAPAVIFDTGEGSGFPTALRVIDLASGTSFPGLASVERYPSIPARMFPRSAGGAWYRSVMRHIR